MAPALGNYPLTPGTQRQPEEQAESSQRPSASSSSVLPVASSQLDPSVSRPIVAPALPVHQPAPGYPMPAAIPDQSLPYPVPVSQSGRDDSSLVPLPASAVPSSSSPTPTGQNNPSTYAVSETTQANSTHVSEPNNAGDFTGLDITDHGTDNSTRTSIPVDPELKSELTTNGRFLDPEKYDPVKLIGSGGFAKVIYHLKFCAFCCQKGSSMLSK